MAHWYMARPHFVHRAVIETFGRPFASNEEMDEALLAGLQARVGPEDDLWIVGDFAWTKDTNRLAAVFARLPGARQHLVIGNRDQALTKALDWTSIHDIVEVEDGPGQRVVLCHYPLATWNQARHGALHLFGHVHSNWPGCRGAVNVGVEWWDYRPVSRVEAEVRSASLPVSPLWGDLEPGALPV